MTIAHGGCGYVGCEKPDGPCLGRCHADDVAVNTTLSLTDELLIELRAIEVGLRAALTALNAALLALEPANVVDLEAERAARRPTLTVA